MSISETMSVNEVIRLYPETVEVFNTFGVDACCGGAQPVGEAAREAGVSWEEIRDALLQAVGAAR